MDKQKQIDKDINVHRKMVEEMATEIARIILSCPLNQGRHCDMCKFNDKDTISYDCQSYLVAEKLLEKYQPKIPENAVVLTMEEFERCKGFSREEVDEISETAIKNARKETAEKFAERMKDTTLYWTDFGRDEDFAKQVDEICKEIIGKGVQNGD